MIAYGTSITQKNRIFKPFIAGISKIKVVVRGT